MFYSNVDLQFGEQQRTNKEHTSNLILLSFQKEHSFFVQFEYNFDSNNPFLF